MVAQYPHYLFLVVPSESFRNADGDFVEGENHIEFISKCRYETNGAGTQLQVGGGNYIISGAMVYAPITDNSYSRYGNYNHRTSVLSPVHHLYKSAHL